MHEVGVGERPPSGYAAVCGRVTGSPSVPHSSVAPPGSERSPRRFGPTGWAVPRVGIAATGRRGMQRTPKSLAAQGVRYTVRLPTDRPRHRRVVGRSGGGAACQCADGPRSRTGGHGRAASGPSGVASSGRLGASASSCKTRYSTCRTVSDDGAKTAAFSVPQPGAPPSSPAPPAPRDAAAGLDRSARPRVRHWCR